MFFFSVLFFFYGVLLDTRIRKIHNLMKSTPSDLDVKRDARLCKSLCIRVKEKANDFLTKRIKSRSAMFQTMVEILTGQLEDRYQEYTTCFGFGFLLMLINAYLGSIVPKETKYIAPDKDYISHLISTHASSRIRKKGNQTMTRRSTWRKMTQ